jgi:putative transposase
MRGEHTISVRRLAKAFSEPPSTIERGLRWDLQPASRQRRQRPVAEEPSLRQRVRELADQPRHRTLGYRRIWALLRREGLTINAKTVRRMMRDMGLSRPKFAYKPRRPKRVEKMHPQRPNQGWQIDMTSFMLSDLTPLFLVTVVDCCTRELVGWTLERRGRAGEWTAAVRMALEARGLMDSAVCRESGLVLRSDNGSQPCSKAFLEFLGTHGIAGQYTGYNAPDDNAYVERVIRTIKEEEIWPNLWDTLSEARQAMEAYVTYYNHDRLHSALDYRTPNEVAAAFITRAAA